MIRFRSLVFCLSLVICAQFTLHAQEFSVAAGSDTTFSGGAVYGGLNGLVAVHGDAASSNSITAQLVGVGGTLIGSRISLGTTGITPGAIPVFDGTNYFLVWLEFTQTLKGQFISTAGTVLGSPLTIATNVTFEHLPYGATIGDASILVTYVKSDEHLYGRMVSFAGSLLGSEFQISSDLARDYSVAFDGTNFLAAWVEIIQESDKDIHGQFISAAGALVGTNFVIDNGPNHSDNPTALAYDGTRYLLAYHEMPPAGTKWTLVGQFITKAGALQESFTICDSTKSPYSPTLASDGTNYLIAWLQGNNGSFMARFFGKTGVPRDTAFVAFPPLNNKFPFGGVGFGGNRYLIVVTRVEATFTNGDVYARFISPLTGVDEGTGVPVRCALQQNYPNPFNPNTMIRYALAERALVKLSVYDILGREVAVLVNGEQEAGSREVQFDGSKLASGVYFYRIHAGVFTDTRRLILLR